MRTTPELEKRSTFGWEFRLKLENVSRGDEEIAKDIKIDIEQRRLELD